MSSKPQIPKLHGYGERVATWARRNADLIMALPEPGAPVEPWAWSDALKANPNLAGEPFRNRRGKLKSYSVIENVAVVRQNGTNTHLWKTNPDIYAVAEGVKAERGDELPCGHKSGFVNHGDTFECGFELCSATYDRETVAEVFL